MVAPLPEPEAHVLCVQAFRVELEFRTAGFWGEGKTGVPGGKLLGAEKTNLAHIWSELWIEPGPHRWEASALTTAPALLPITTGSHLPSARQLMGHRTGGQGSNPSSNLNFSGHTRYCLSSAPTCEDHSSSPWLFMSIDCWRVYLAFCDTRPTSRPQKLWIMFSPFNLPHLSSLSMFIPLALIPSVAIMALFPSKYTMLPRKTSWRKHICRSDNNLLPPWKKLSFVT